MELTPERIAILAKRAAAAKELVDQGRVHQLVGTVAPDQYVAIHSKGAWLIGRNAGSYPWYCSCPDWQYRGEETLGHCKHVLAVLLYRDANPPEVSAMASRPQAEGRDMEAQISELYK